MIPAAVWLMASEMHEHATDKNDGTAALAAALATLGIPERTREALREYRDTPGMTVRARFEAKALCAEAAERFAAFRNVAT